MCSARGPWTCCFVEFAVNDDQDSDQAYHDALRGMEGIIAQARKHNPKVDIVMTMFVNENILEKLQKGETTDSVKAHSKVAEHHGISVNHLAQELADLITCRQDGLEEIRRRAPQSIRQHHVCHHDRQCPA